MLEGAAQLVTRRRRPGHDDRGSVAANTVVTAAVLGLFVVAVQICLIYLTHETARGAARGAADIARLENGTVEEGTALARQFLDNHSALEDPEVTVTRTDDTVTVTITGTAPSPLPGLHPPVNITLTAPVERVVDT